MKATRILIAQHRAIEALFVELTRETGRQARARAASRLTEEIIAHMAGEEAIFYPAAQRVLGKSFGPQESATHTHASAALDSSAADPHFMLRVQLRRVLATHVQDPAFEPRSEALRLLFAHHVEVEETVLFPQVEEALADSQLETLGGDVLGSRPPIWLVTTEGRALIRSSRPVRGVRLPAVR
jgi:iron-sulfur cluster repair protein YtfE (RIC family)